MIAVSEVAILDKIKLMAMLAIVPVTVYAQAGYGGPQVLSRSSSAVGERPGANTGFQYYGGVGVGYETGILPASVDEQGRILDTGGLVSVWASLGAYGRHTWRRTALGLDYAGSYRHYTTASNWDSSDHVIGLQLAHQPSRRLRLETVTRAGTVSRYFVTGNASLSDIITPANYALFDSRAYYLQTDTGITYQKSARLYFTASGQGFAVRHRSKDLVGLDGYGAQGAIAYRVNKRRTVEASYRYTHIDYVRGFGESDMFIYMIGLGESIGKRWQFNVSGGAAQINSIGLESVATDPLTRALFGNTTTVEAFSKQITVGAGTAALSGKFKTSTVTLSYNQMPSPGNGIYLTSRQQAAQAMYRYIGIRKVAVGAFMGYSQMRGIGQEALGNTWWANGGFDVAVKLHRSLEAIGRYDARSVQIDAASGFSRLGYAVSFGLNWHPGEIPLSIW